MIPEDIYNELQECLVGEDKTEYCPSNAKRVYIAGPMRGYPNLNFDSFFKAEERLKNKGYYVINPARNPLGLQVKEYMDIDLLYVKICDSIYMLKGWEGSIGALDEFSMAKSKGKAILYEEDNCEFHEGKPFNGDVFVLRSLDSKDDFFCKIMDIGFDGVFYTSRDPKYDDRFIEDCDYMFLENGWDKDNYNWYLYKVAEQMNKIFIDE